MDPWLPITIPEFPFSTRNLLDKNERVSLLINGASHSWDVELVHALFLP